MKISEVYKLGVTQYELDFIDIDIDSDIPLFLDSYFIRNLNSPFGLEAKQDIKTFIEYFYNLLRSGMKKEAKQLFSYLNEPNETCLGLSIGKPRGRGVGPTDAEKIFDNIINSSAFHAGILEDLEDLRIFVPGVDKDKISDMTTNIIRGQLIKYTQDQCTLWGIPLTNGVPSGYVWNKKQLIWEDSYTNMLVVNGKKILLVPKNIVTFSKEYTPQKYLQHFVLNFLQRKHMTENSHLVQVYQRKDGSERRFVTKKSIKSEFQTIDKDFLVKFTVNHPEVFRDFKKQTKHQLHAMLNEEITSDSLIKIIEYLKNKLISIPKGPSQATSYHRTITGMLELLCYPNLTSPSVEEEIHDGRKRIDIVFNNSAESGFFFRLPTVHQIASSFIVVECKNYSRDVANPELDQISGRFSINRGKIGLLLCRDIDDMDLFLERCRDTYKDGRGMIIPIVDEDIIAALDNFAKEGQGALENIINNRFNQIGRS